jgi:hypothetical protein
MRTAQQKALVGPAGEHFVLFRLHQQGLLASLSPEGSPTVDVLVLSPDETVIASLQVKTRTYGRDRGWHMKKKHESIAKPRYFYAFVDLEPEQPVTYIVPSGVVAEVLRKSHQAWLAAPGAKGQRRNDNVMRRIQPEYPDPFEGYVPNWLDEWRERWDLLNAAVQA